jgi:predicted unusual protein kinase regulating ubiquinone biosynthesis (AarF/ABC1/UbiB family)
VLGGLKGGAMKFGQSLSMFEAALPEDLAAPYRATLTKLQDTAPAMSTKSLHGVLADQLGVRWRSKFREFDDEPRAAASIGQVHHAVWRDGREVAVKVQYPGAAEALMSDLNQLSRVARMSTGWVPGLDVAPILRELKGRMAEETDYSLEAAMHEQFAEAYADDPHYLLPEVVFATEQVIVSDWIDGVPLSRIIDSGTTEERDLAAARYFEFLVSGPERAGLLHADPHPGNFRLLPDGRLGVLDFGAVNRLPDGLPSAMGELISAALRGDELALLDGLRDEGFVKRSIDVDAQDVLEYLGVFLKPLRSNEFRFDRDWLRGIFNFLNDPRNTTFTVGLRLNLPPNYVMIHRAWLGGIAVLCQVGGNVPAREIFDRWVPGADLPPLSRQ